MPHAAQKANKRQDLLEIASRLFYEQGYNCTGVQQIIEEADIAKGTFYAHFKSKEELAVAWLKERHHYWNNLLNEVVQRSEETPQARLLAFFDFLVEWGSQSDYRGCAFLNTLSETPDPNSPLRKEIASHKLSLLSKVQGLVDEHMPSSNKKKRTQTAQAIFLLFEGAIMESQNFRADWPAKTAKAQVKQILQQAA